MDIRNWGIDRIMQLPDWCFGRKFAVCCEVSCLSTQQRWDISEVALPEKIVIWHFMLQPLISASYQGTVRIALGDQLPVSTAMMDLLQPLIQGLGPQGAEPRHLPVYTAQTKIDFDLRFPVEASGRRLILEGIADENKMVIARVVIVVSSMPTEVPDWLVSGQANAL